MGDELYTDQETSRTSVSEEKLLWDKLEPIDEYKLERMLLNEIDESITDVSQFPSPYEFKDMDKCVEMLVYAIVNNLPILCVSDSDADGMGTYVIFTRFFKAIQYKNVEIIIAKRADGYGFMPKHIIERKVKPYLIITADNGITAHSACDLAREMGILTIITDHHQVNPKKGIPNADAVVDPHRPDCNFPYPMINGTFVLWFVIKAVSEKLGYKFDLFHEFLGELTLTTISDVMPLRNINRFIVKYGLANFPNLNSPWVRCFLDGLLNNVKTEVTTEDMGFGLIPCINAPGRLTDPQESANFLSADNIPDAMIWYDRITQVNNTRKDYQQQLEKHILEHYAKWFNFPFILIPGKGDIFHKGILGPVSGRLAERFNKPSIVLTLSPDSSYFSGSGRSVGKVNLLGIIRKSKELNFDKSGGHEAACGVTFNTQNLWRFWKDIQLETKDLDRMLFRPKLQARGLIEIHQLPELFDMVKKYEPYGQEFEKPLFGNEFTVKSATKMGALKNHMRGVLTDGKSEINFIWFNFSEPLKNKMVRKFIFSIEEDTFNKENSGEVELILHIKKVVSNI